MQTNNKLIELAERTKIEKLNLFSMLDRIASFEDDNIEEIYFSNKANESFIIIKADIDKFRNIEDFILHAHIGDDLKYLQILSTEEIHKIICPEFLVEGDRAIRLKKISRHEIRESFIKKVLREVHVRINDIELIYWLEEDPKDYMDQSLIFNTDKHLYYINGGLG